MHARNAEFRNGWTRRFAVPQPQNPAEADLKRNAHNLNAALHIRQITYPRMLFEQNKPEAVEAVDGSTFLCSDSGQIDDRIMPPVDHHVIVGGYRGSLFG